ncbi:MAG: extracellular solute-binding protein [Candidatus Ozemobacteraceae bacterium]
MDARNCVRILRGGFLFPNGNRIRLFSFLRRVLLVFSGLLLSGSICLAAEGEKSTELTFWNFWNPKFITPVIASFEAEHPGITIKNEQLNWGNGLDKIVVSLANGHAPDICELGSTWTGKFMSGEALLDVTDSLKDLTHDYLMWEPATWKGRRYGMPWLVGTRVLFYNKTLFRAAGLDPEKPPTTWDELLSTAKALHNPEKNVYGFGINAGEGHILYKKVLPFVWGNDGGILDADGRFVFDSAAVRQAFEFYRRLSAFGLKEKQDILDDAFKKGHLGLEISGSWNFAKFPKEVPDLDFGVTLIPRPAPDRGHTSSFLGGEVLVLFKNCRNPTVAIEFVRYLTRAENTLPITKESMVSFPADRKAFSDPFFTNDPRLSVFVKQMETGIHPPIHPLWIELESIINEAVEKITYGADIDASLKAATAAYERVQAQDTARRHDRESSRSGQPGGIISEQQKASAFSSTSASSAPSTAATFAPPTTTSSGPSGATSESPSRAGETTFPAWMSILVSLIALATLVNAILAFLIYGEVKKKVDEPVNRRD